MKWLLTLILLIAVPLFAQPTKCSPMEFYGLCMTLNNPSERHDQADKWLSYNGLKCSSEDLTFIWNGMSEWLGSSDSAQLRVKVALLYEKALQREQKK
jgi:hypothetical protein